MTRVSNCTFGSIEEGMSGISSTHYSYELRKQIFYRNTYSVKHHLQEA